MVYLKTLRKAYETFLFNKDIGELLTTINTMGNIPTSDIEDGNNNVGQIPIKEKNATPKREDLKLICFEYVWH